MDDHQVEQHDADSAESPRPADPQQPEPASETSSDEPTQAAIEPADATVDDDQPPVATEDDGQQDAPQPPYRLRLPSPAERHRRARQEQLAANDVLWRYIATEAADAPTDRDLTVEQLEDAMATLGVDWDFVAGWVDRIRASKSKLHPVDLDRLRDDVANTTRKLHKATEKAARLRQQADRVERDAQGALAQANELLDAAQRSEGEAAQLAQEALVAGCPGAVDLGLRDRPRMVRCVRPTIEEDRALNPGDLLHYRGPDRPWFEDYTGDVQLDEHGRGHDPIDTPDINERNEQIAEEAEAAAQQFETDGLPGVRLHHEGEQRTLVTQQIQVTQRPTREQDIANRLPTQVEVTVQPSDGQAGQAQSDQPEQSDPWGFDE